MYIIKVFSVDPQFDHQSTNIYQIQSWNNHNIISVADKISFMLACMQQNRKSKVFKGINLLWDNGIDHR